MAIPEGVGSSVVKKGPTACLGFGHHIGVGGVSLQGRFEMTGLDAVMLAVIHNGFAQSILPDQSCGLQGKGGPEFGQIHENIVRRTTGSLRLGCDVCQ